MYIDIYIYLAPHQDRYGHDWDHFARFDYHLRPTMHAARNKGPMGRDDIDIRNKGPISCVCV